MAFKAHAAELVVHRPLPGGVHVAVEEDAPLHLSGAGADRRHVGPGLFREEGVYHRVIQDKLEQHQRQSGGAEEDAQPGGEEKTAHAEEIQHRGNTEIAVEPSGVEGIGLDLYVRAAALPAQRVGHVPGAGPLPLAPRAPGRQLPADVLDLANYITHALPAFFQQGGKPVLFHLFLSVAVPPGIQEDYQISGKKGIVDLRRTSRFPRFSLPSLLRPPGFGIILYSIKAVMVRYADFF